VGSAGGVPAGTGGAPSAGGVPRSADCEALKAPGGGVPVSGSAGGLPAAADGVPPAGEVPPAGGVPTASLEGPRGQSACTRGRRAECPQLRAECLPRAECRGVPTAKPS
jgi:hypothetical protein